jgi:hypothetical protein
MSGGKGDDRQDLVSLLMPQSAGREAANKVLTWVREQNEARCASLWSAAGELRLLLSASLDQEGLTAAERTWREQRRILAEGSAVQTGAQLIVSIDIEGVPYLMALEEVMSPRLSVESLTRYAGVAIRALVHDSPDAGWEDGAPREALEAVLVRETFRVAGVGAPAEFAGPEAGGRLRGSEARS